MTQASELISNDAAGIVSDVLKAISDPSRIRILALLAGNEYPVNQVSEILNMSQSAVSHQLKTLRSSRLVQHRREGQNIIYSFNDEHILNIFNLVIERSIKKGG